MPDVNPLMKDVLDKFISGEIPLPPAIAKLEMGSIARFSYGYVYKEWEVRPEMFLYQGGIFGGYIAALADQITTAAAITTIELTTAMRTADLSINFFRPITEGVIEIEGRVVNQSRKQIFVEATFTVAGKLCAKARATLVKDLDEP